MNRRDWRERMREECAATSQQAVGARIGYSPTVVNQVLKGNYKGNAAKVEAAFRGAYEHATVECPVVGEIEKQVCLMHQRRPFAATSDIRVRLWQACRSGCPHSSLKRNDK